MIATRCACALLSRALVATTPMVVLPPTRPAGNSGSSEDGGAGGGCWIPASSPRASAQPQKQDESGIVVLPCELTATMAPTWRPSDATDEALPSPPLRPPARAP